MKNFKWFVYSGLAFIFVILCAYVLINYYPFVFSRRVVGVIERVERVQVNVSLLQQTQQGKVSSDLFSFAVAIKDDKGEIVTASSEDRQWAVAQPGQCAEARFYPYPPWNLEKAGTYHGARLLKLTDCRDRREPPAVAPQVPETAP
jgi:hypothetical protein